MSERLLQTTSNQAPYTGQMSGMPTRTSFIEDDFIRPMTAVRGVGYSSHGRPGTGMFDPLNQRLQPGVGLEKREET